MARKQARHIQFITEFAAQSGGGGDKDEFVIPTELDALSLNELQELHSQAISHFDAVYADGTGFSEEDIKALEDLTSGIEALQAELSNREQHAAELAAQAAELASRAKGVEPAAEEVDPAESAEPEAPTDEMSSKGVRVNLSRLRQRASHVPTPAPEAPQAPALQMKDLVLAAGDGNVFSAGTPLDWEGVGKAIDHRLASFNRPAFDAAQRSGRRLRQQFSIATIRKPIPANLMVNSSDVMHVEEVIANARNEKNLPGGSLVASGGWCAPSETLYDLYEAESRDGIFSLPEIGIARGGINRTLGPDFASIYAATGWGYTEAEDIAGDYDGEGGGSKPCYHVECTDFEDIRLQLQGLCLTAGLLQVRGYPELIARVTRGALVAHDHKMASIILNAVQAGSTAVLMPGPQQGAIAPVLNAMELQSEHMRYVNRMGRGATIEVVAPYWIRGVIRNDLARRAGVDLISVPDSRINAWFTERGIVPQYVYNFQDLTGTAGTVLQWPSKVTFLMYPAGAWVRGTSDIITLDTLYDSTLLGTNDYTALYSEEGWLVVKMAHDSRAITVPICPDGAAAAGVDFMCDGTTQNPSSVTYGTTTATTTAAPVTTTTTTSSGI